MLNATTVLASDMDGTFIPLDGSEENRRDLQILSEELRRRRVELLYVTGRHFELALEAVRLHQLPVPAWLICDVGTSIYRHLEGHQFRVEQAYWEHLADIIGHLGMDGLRHRLSGINGLVLQPPEKQGQFKLSYDCDVDRLTELTDQLMESLSQDHAPFRVIPSVDPFTGGGLIDLLPRGVSKAYALEWWVEQHDRPAEAIMFAGDSGNDLAALSAGYRSIVVGNARTTVIDQVAAAHQQAGWHDRLFLCSKPATSGVLEGFRHFADGASSQSS